MLLKFDLKNYWLNIHLQLLLTFLKMLGRKKAILLNQKIEAAVMFWGRRQKLINNQKQNEYLAPGKTFQTTRWSHAIWNTD